MRNLAPQFDIFLIFILKDAQKGIVLPAPNALKADAALLNNDAGLLRNGEEGAVIKTSPAPPELPVSRSIGTGAGIGGGGGTSCEPKTLLTAVWKIKFFISNKKIRKCGSTE